MIDLIICIFMAYYFYLWIYFWWCECEYDWMYDDEFDVELYI